MRWGNIAALLERDINTLSFASLIPVIKARIKGHRICDCYRR